MKKYLLFIILTLIPLTLCAWGVGMSGVSLLSGSEKGGAGGSCASCNSGTDSQIVNTGITADDDFVYIENTWFASRMTVSSDICATGLYFYSCDYGASDYGSITVELYTDNSGQPGSRVSAGYTGSISDLADALAINEVLFASTQELPAGTYWVVVKFTTLGASGPFIGVSETGGGYHMYSVDSGSSWTDVTAYGYYFELGILGCSK